MPVKDNYPFPTRYIFRSDYDSKGTAYHTRNVRHVARDAVVYINRSIKFTSANMKVNTAPRRKEGEKRPPPNYESTNVPYIDIVENLNVNLSINSSPGSAGFTLAIPDHAPTKLYFRGYNFIRPMMEVHIFIKGRYPLEDENSASDKYPYYQVFWGVISSVQESRDASCNVKLQIEPYVR